MRTVNSKPRRNLRIAKIASSTKEPARAMPTALSSGDIVIVGGEHTQPTADQSAMLEQHGDREQKDVTAVVSPQALRLFPVPIEAYQ
jgi:uncharacterized protein YgbK (DUF1537 family)